MLYHYQEFDFPTELTPFEVFERLSAQCDHAFILESLGAESEFSRFTYVGAEPQVVVSGRENELSIHPVEEYDRTSLTTGNSESPYRALKKLIPKVEGLPSHYHGGLVGYVSYDGTAYFEPAFEGKVHPEFSQFEFGLYVDGFLFDKHTQSMRYFTLSDDRREYFKTLIEIPYQHNHFIARDRVVDMTKSEYEKAFEKIKEHIRSGDIFQTVFSVGSSWDIEGSPVAIYQQLRQINPSPHMYCLKFGTRYALGASPELLFRTEGRDIEHFGTLTGTIHRGNTAQEDESLADQLQHDEKEVAEHMMLVDLARNDVGKVAEFGSVKAEKLMAVKKYSHVQHLSTEIRGKLKQNLDSFDVLAACAPAGTLTGAPKIEAMKIIAELEKSPRGIYGGSVGYFSVNGDAMFAIAIRSLFVSGNHAYTRSGSGIVYDSICEKEYEEVLNKQKALEEALKV